MKRLVAGLALLALPLLAPAREKPATAPVVEGNTQFALELYGKLRGKEGNLFLSPYSISTALAMTSGGARGKTLEQMTAVLHLPDQKELHPAMASLIRQVNGEPGKKRGYQLKTANALWGQQGHPFLPAFLKLQKDHYGAGLRQVDFKGDAEGARKTINAWVERQTEKKIKDLLPRGILDSMTRLVLTNAIYFKGDWQFQFKKDATREQPFHLADGGTVKVPLMYQQGRFGYFETKAFQALEMPYTGKHLSMVVLLPRKADGLPALERDLTPANLAPWLRGLRQRVVRVYFPRYKLTSQFALKPTLQAMGMELPFSRASADFSGMDGKKDLYISAVVHKAFVDVNEKGTEAAAATGVVVKAKSARKDPPTTPVFRADRPFVFLIRDTRNGSVLFLGRLVKPKG
jgi:serpin B